MKKARKMLSAVMAVLFMSVTFLSVMPEQAMAKKTVLPKVRLISGPKAEYEFGEMVYMKFNSPNYRKKVQYRVILWDVNKRTQTELWPSMPGYYNNRWVPIGPTTFTFRWPIQPGTYNMTILVKRAYAKVGYDSYYKTRNFTIKPKVEPKEVTFTKAGETYGPMDAAKPETIKKDIYIKANNVTLRNLNVEANVIVDPGKDGVATLDNVTAKTIKVLSGAEKSIHLKNVKAEKLEAASKNSKARIEISGNTKVKNTIITENTILENKEGTFGNITVLKNAEGKYEVELRGKFEETIVVEGDVILKAAKGAEIAKIEVAPEKKDSVVTLVGNFGEVVIKNESKVVVAEGSTVKNVEVNAKAEVVVEKGAAVEVLDKNNNDVKVDNQGTVTKQENTGGTSDIIGGGIIFIPSQPTPVKDDIDKLAEAIVSDFNGSANLSSRATAAYDYTTKNATITIIKNNETIKEAYTALQTGANASDTGILALLNLIFNDNVKITTADGEKTLSAYIASKLPDGTVAGYFKNKNVTGLAAYLKTKDYNTLSSLIRLALAPDKTKGVADIDLHTISVYGQKLDYIKINTAKVYDANTKTLVTINELKSAFGITTELGDANYATAFKGDVVEFKLGTNNYILNIK